MPGYSLGNTCFATLEEAHDAYFQALPPSITPHGTYTNNSFKFIHFDKVAGVWQLSHDTYSATGVLTPAWSVAAQLPVLEVCTTPNTPAERFSDGMLLGWGVAGAMIVVYVIRRVFR